MPTSTEIGKNKENPKMRDRQREREGERIGYEIEMRESKDVGVEKIEEDLGIK